MNFTFRRPPIHRAIVASSFWLVTDCAAPPRPTMVPERPPPPPLLQIQVESAKPKEGPFLPDYPCSPKLDESSVTSSKRTEASASKKAGEEKKPASWRLTLEVLERIVQAEDAKFSHCYGEGLRTDPNLIGRVTMRFVIGRDGTITSLGPVCTSMPDREVVRCVTEAYRTITFPNAEGGNVTVVYSIMFSPAD